MGPIERRGWRPSGRPWYKLSFVRAAFRPALRRSCVIPDLSVLWVIFFVLLLATILNGLLFKPLIRVMAAREAAVASARQLAERAATQARAASDEFDARTREARAEVYRQMEEARRAALERRTELLAETRGQAEASIAEATARVRAEAAEARSRLDRDAETLATTITERVLGRTAS
jgi:F-type H+-transporting ATPase subunit b